MIECSDYVAVKMTTCFFCCQGCQHAILLRCAAITIYGASVERLASQVYRCVDRHLKVGYGARNCAIKGEEALDTGIWADLGHWGTGALGHWARQEGGRRGQDLQGSSSYPSCH